MKKIKIFGFMSVFIAGIILIIIKFMPSDASYKTVNVSNITLKAEVANTDMKRIRGLMGREKLAENSAMLFTFDKPDRYGIWMMNVSFPIDILWIDGKMNIVDIAEGAQPCMLYCPTYMPDHDAPYVLEVNSGFVEKNKIHVGDAIKVI